jgi:hypothetical protein
MRGDVIALDVIGVMKNHLLLCPSVCMEKLENSWIDFFQICYGRHAI